jgi:hypothetical protein
MGITIIQNPVPLVLLDSKGDMFVATGDDTVARLGVGADGTVLTAESTETGGVIWATPEASLAAASGDTDDLNEGVSNLFFTDARKQSTEIGSLFFFS